MNNIFIITFLFLFVACLNVQKKEHGDLDTGQENAEDILTLADQASSEISETSDSNYEKACDAFCDKCLKCKDEKDFKGKMCLYEKSQCLTQCNAFIKISYTPEMAGMFAAQAPSMTCQQFDALFP
jgi:hypothetical protein